MKIDIENVKFENSAMGKSISELQKLRDDFDKYRAEQKAEQKRNEERAKIERKRNFFISIVSGSISGVIGGLVVYYWPVIISFF